jgi:hypothetical protein
MSVNEWDGREVHATLCIACMYRLCVSPPESIRRSRPEHVFTALNTNEPPTPQGLRRGQVIRLYQTLDQGAPKRSDGGLG